MKHLKMIGLAAVAAMALMAFGVSSASATTLAITGVKQTGKVTIDATAEGSIKLEKTDHTFANTCTESTVEGETTSFTSVGTAPIGGPITTLTFKKCTTESVVVDAPGSLSIEWIEGTSNGTVKSSNAKVTVPSPFGALTCETGAGNDIGTLTGKSTGFATMDIKAVLNCGFLAPSAIWEGSYNITEPHNLSVVS